jgi:DNA-directed RNA polymerase delta subunit
LCKNKLFEKILCGALVYKFLNENRDEIPAYIDNHYNEILDDGQFVDFENSPNIS